MLGGGGGVGSGRPVRILKGSCEQLLPLPLQGHMPSRYVQVPDGLPVRMRRRGRMLASRRGQVEVDRHLTARYDAGARHRFRGDRAILAGMRLCRELVIAVFDIGRGHGGGAHVGSIA